MNSPVNKKRLNFSLQDRYTAEEGWHYMTGLQALVRLPIQQRIRDAAAGLDTGGFISGYRGSPIGRYDMELWQAADEFNKRSIVFQPGVNEDLAATATWGAQYVGMFPGAKVEGVFSIWYGKAPGMDRSMDPIRHANLAGTSSKGGTLLLVGDDHGAKSSTVACYSDYNFVSAGIPLLAPANAQEVLDYGLHGIAMSRFAGCLTGLKLVTDVVEGGGSVFVSPSNPGIVLPEERVDAGIHLFRPFLEQERTLYSDRLDNALNYVRANKLNQIVAAGPKARVGVVAGGKAWQDLAQALRDLGIRDGVFPGGEVRLMKIGVTWPLDDRIVQEFAEGLDAIVVVEEKRPLLEEQLRAILYGRPQAPKIIGKFFEGRAYGADRGEVAFPNDGEIDPGMTARIVARAVLAAHPEAGLAIPNADQGQMRAGGAQRPPSFCAGCPHGRSTQVIEGSRALAGIGCHSMAMFRDPAHTNSMSHMGGEGAMWIGQKPFTDEPHVFTNMGDGTYFHSGLLAIRAAVAAGVPITYKLLHNGFVSMTGGQPIDGELSPEQMTGQLLAEGVGRIALVADEPEKYRGKKLPEGVTLHDRIELEAVQQELREFPGVSVMLYDQPCATERRRLRKRGRWPDPDRRVFINAAVCEGCGDCGTVSHCMAIEPLETEYGRKRVINQSSCNKDFSCVEGFCPSFVTVSGAKPRAAKGAALAELDARAIPEPAAKAIEGSYAVLVSGIGGTGVVTIGQTLAVAAHVDGLCSSNLDVTGLAQKYGAVHSHVKFAETPQNLYATRIAAGEADAIVGCDIVVTAGAEALAKLKQPSGILVADRSLTPTAEFSKNPDWALDVAELEGLVRRAVGEDASIIDAHEIASALLGDTIYANMVLLGAAWQLGGFPLSHDALMRAIELNGVKIDQNKLAFSVGRLAAHDPDQIAGLMRRGAPEEPVRLADRRTKSLEELVGDRKAVLTDYQNGKLAERFEERVRGLDEAARTAGLGDGLAMAAARYYFKLLAHKDEWEVARLYARPEFLEDLRRSFDGDLKLTFHVGAWPFGRMDAKSGKPVKGEVGSWLLPVFGIMAKLRFLRGSVFDPFRNNKESRLARSLRADYESDIDFALQYLDVGVEQQLVDLLSLPEKIRGYGHVREAHAAKARVERSALRAKISGQAVADAA